jgi:lysophospholipase L1-like esterase
LVKKRRKNIMGTIIEDGSKLVMIGDSITDCGRRGEQHKPYGCGYVSMFRDLVIINEPEKSIEIINKGIGGNTVEDLRSRWDDDLLSHQPDWVTIKIGINDLHRYLSNGDELQSSENFEKIYDEIIAATKSEFPECKLVLISPFYMSRRNSVKDAYRTKVWELLPTYISIVEKLSQKHETLFLNTHDLFQEQLKYNHPDLYCGEPVHPNQTGHMLIAQGLYDTIKR